ncbi:HAD hydrolase family protein [Candidatus Oleimmundimicrobium sp.]|uniref:HAD hydrolase family protein n=1 Tax=Candidatus Oleimmundimicrobium sp. TaxID=3060597 RepID=UPI002725D7EC|nr:HAD hydrolase family protein [Candidatus Oleimmundimicrobium sp.]MDO8886860.1 HAD hydrolase family protein [Candidatus Oleimmundimicrobium sp.]
MNLDIKKVMAERSLKNNTDWLKANLKKIKVLYTDVDGTLVGARGSLFLTANGEYTLEPAKAIVETHKNEIDVVMISGRSARQLFGDARLLGFKNYIAELGCEIVYDLGKKIIENPGCCQITEATLYETIAKSGVVELLLKKYPDRLEYHTPWSESRKCTHVFRGFIDVKEAINLLEENGFSEFTLADNGIIKRRGTLNKDLPEIHAYHLLPKATGKPEGLKKDREIRNIPKECTVAIGDAFSDIVLAPHVGAFFLVRNALSGNNGMEKEIMKYENVFVTETEMGLGFAEVIKFLIGEIG